jgi:hypothetical protein
MKQKTALKKQKNLENKKVDNLIIPVVLIKINKKYITVGPLFKTYKKTRR